MASGQLTSMSLPPWDSAARVVLLDLRTSGMCHSRHCLTLGVVVYLLLVFSAEGLYRRVHHCWPDGDPMRPLNDNIACKLGQNTQT